MFLGITAHHDAKRVTDFTTAQAALERASRTPKGKLRTQKDYGYHLGMNRNHGVTWVGERGGGAIAFRLYDTDVVTWHPDDSVVIQNFGTVTTSGFATRFLPNTIHLRHPSRDGGDSAITYRPATVDGDWRSAWKAARICQGHAVRFVRDGEALVPDEDTLDPIMLPQLDTKASRGLTAGLNLADFELWLPAATAHLDLEHEGFDLDECVTALRRRDFRTAATLLPLVKIPDGWGAADRIKPLPIDTSSREQVVTLGSITKLRLAIQHDAGAFTDVTQPTWSLREYERGMARVKQLASVDAVGYGYGAN